MMYIVTIAASSRKISLVREDSNAELAPRKFAMKLVGSFISCCAARISRTASPSDAPGAKLNEIVAAGNWPRYPNRNGVSLIEPVLIADSGTWPAPDVKPVEADQLGT